MTRAEAINVVDLVLKGIIGIAVSFAGIMIKNTSDDLSELKGAKEVIHSRVAVVESKQLESERRLQRIEDKIDTILKFAKDHG